MCLCRGCDGCCILCLYCEAWSCWCSCMGSVSVSSCRCYMFVSCVHFVAVPNDALRMTCSLLMLVEDAIGDHTEEAYSRAGTIIQTFLFKVVGPGLVSTSPAFCEQQRQPSSGSAWPVCQKKGKSGPHCCGRGGSTQFAQQPESSVISPPHVGCVVWSHSIWLPLASSTSTNHLQVMQNTALRTATGFTQDTNIQHLHDETLDTMQTENTTSITHPTQTYNNTQMLKKHYLHQRPIHNKHSHRLPHNHYNRHKNKHAPYTHIYCLYASSHKSNNKILRTPPVHISSSEEILHALFVAPLPNSEQINHPSSNHIYTKSTPYHIHHHYAPSVTHTDTHDTHHLFNFTHIRTTLSPLDLWADPSEWPHCWPDGRRNWLVDHKREHRTPPTSKGHGNGYTTTTHLNMGQYFFSKNCLFDFQWEHIQIIL